MSAVPISRRSDDVRRFFRAAAVWLLIATLAWSPFPLGGAVAWAAGVQEILIASSFFLWAVSAIGAETDGGRSARLAAVPLVLAVLALAWACVQIIPDLPAAWIHPVWSMAADALEEPVTGFISLNPWRTGAETARLSSYVMAAWLAFNLAQKVETARTLQSAIIAIGSSYVIYGIVLALSGYRQTDVFYGLPHLSDELSGPFVNRNSFATYAGLVCITATTRLFAKGSESIVAGRGTRRLIASVLDYCFGRGALVLTSAMLCFAAVVASASRAGFASTMCGLATLAIASLFVAAHQSSRRWAGGAAAVVMLPLAVLVIFNGETLGDRLAILFDTGTSDAVRLTLWDASWRMVLDAPVLGLGLGTFQDAYPMYATRVMPYIMDRAHCDYLEFAAGIGLPAAIAWWLALLWVAGLCIRALRVRRRNRVFALTTIGAGVLLAVHSAVDFSLQMPCIALLFAALVGMGVAQCTSARTRHAPA